MISLSRIANRKMLQNLAWATGYNVVAIPLAAGVLYRYGIVLPPAVGALVMSLSTIIVAINARLIRYGRHGEERRSSLVAVTCSGHGRRREDAYMKPIGPLMIEHRLIERMIGLLEGELQTMKTAAEANTGLIMAGVDFFRMYADRTHHGKEEDILFVGASGQGAVR